MPDGREKLITIIVDGLGYSRELVEQKSDLELVVKVLEHLAEAINIIEDTVLP